MKVRGNTVGTISLAQAPANIGALSGIATIKNGVLVVHAAAVKNNILITK